MANMSQLLQTNWFDENFKWTFFKFFLMKIFLTLGIITNIFHFCHLEAEKYNFEKVTYHIINV